MGVMTDFFLASSTDLARVLTGWQLPQQSNREASNHKQAGPANLARGQASIGFTWQRPPEPNPEAVAAPKIDTLPNVQCRGMLPERLALLFATLAEIPTEQALDLILHGYLTGPPETEVTVQRLPPALMNALAMAAPADLLRAAETLEEDELERWGHDSRETARELAEILRRVQSLAKHGVSIEADLFIWTCT
jgi:hypothetical protein